MSSHSHKRVERTVKNQTKFSSSGQSHSPNTLGTHIGQNRNYEEESSQNLHYRLIYDTLNYPSEVNFEELSRTKDVLLDLIDEFKKGNRRVVIDGSKKSSYEKRLQLLQHEINGLMKQKLVFQAPDREGGTRKLDYAVILNEKQNQIVELEKKIQNLQQRVRRANQRQAELENQIIFLHSNIKTKNSLIESKEKLISQQIAYSKTIGDILTTMKSKLRSNRQLQKTIVQEIGLNSLERNQIKSMSSKVAHSKRGGFVSNEILKLVRGLQNLSTRNIDKEELERFIQGWILGLPSDSQLKQKLLEGQNKVRDEERVKSVNQKFKYASEIYKSQISKLKTKNPAIDLQFEQNIFETLRDGSSRVSLSTKGVVQIEKSVVKTVQVPVQDARTKQLIHKLATQMKKIYTKYPKLYDQIDPKLAEYFSQQLIDVIQVDQIDRLIEVVKYEPQVVRVENVYAYNSEKSRKVEFHLRVLLKALLSQMEKITKKTGQVPEIDEGVVGLIRQQIMDVVDVDDILKVYRTVPKIVQVQKVVEKIVQKIVQVPKLVAVENRVQVPVEVKKVDIVENVRNVPIEVPKVETVYVQKFVQVPQYIEKVVEVPKVIENIVQVVKQIPKIVQVQKVVQKIVQVEKIKEVKEDIVVKVPEYHQIIVQKEILVPTQKIIEVLKPVQIVVEKVQQVVKQVPKIVEVQKIKEVIVEKPVYYPAPSIEHEIVVKEVPVDRIIEKIVPIIKTQDRIIEVPKIVEKIVEVRDIFKQVVEIQVIRERPIIQQEVNVVQTTVEKPVIQRVEVQKVVDRFIEVPVVQQVVRVQKQFIKQPIVEVVERIIYKQVQVEKPVVLYQDRVVEVEKIVNHFISEPQIINILEEKIIPLQKTIKEPVAVPTIVEKVIEKLVEVPKVIEVQKVVQKIIPVPRVVEKVVEVEKIVQKIVNKIIVEEKIVQVEKIVEIPAIQERVLEVEAPRNVYYENQVPVEVIKEVMVRDEVNTQRVQIHQIEQPPRVIVQRQQIPKSIMVEKIVPLSIPQTNLVFLDKQIVVPVQIQIPVQIQKEKLVPIEHIREQIVEVDREREKIVPVTVEPDPNIIEIERIQEKPIIQQKIKIIVEEKPYYETVIQEVKTYEEKVVPPVTVEVEKVLKVTQICDRIVDRIVETPKVYEIEKKVQKVIEKPTIIEVDKIVPHIINVNSYIETIAEKLIDIPVLLERLKQIERVEEKIVPVTNTQTQIRQVDRNIERVVIEEKIKQAVDKIHVTQQILKVADRVITKDADPVIITQDKVMQVPFIVEKIVEKIVVMPQIVEVLKYVHQITEQQTLGASVPADLGRKQAEYKNLAGNMRTELNSLLSKLKSLWKTQPSLRMQIQTTQKFLSEFEKFVLYPRIHEIVNEKEVQKIVETKKVVTVPTGAGEEDVRMELSKAILIEKLIKELKRIREQNPRMQFEFDEDIKLIFGHELNSRSRLVGSQINNLIDEYARSVQSKFDSMGGWTRDHQVMLNSFLEERFLMANVMRTANSDLNKTKAISEKRLQAMRKYKYERDEMEKAFNLLNSFLPSVLQSGKKSRIIDTNTQKKATQWMSSFSQYLFTSTIKGGEPTRLLDKLEQTRSSSLLREKEEEILKLKQQIRRLMKSEKKTQTQYVYKQVSKNTDHSNCNSKIRELESRLLDSERRWSQRGRNMTESMEYEKSVTLQREIEKTRSIERQYKRKNDQLNLQLNDLLREIERLRIIERQHMKCGKTIDNLNQHINLLERRLKGFTQSLTIGESQLSGRQKSQQSSSSYGVNYMEYTNLQEFGNKGVGQIETKEGFKPTYSKIATGGDNVRKTRYFSSTQGHEKGQGGTTTNYKKTYQKRQYSSGQGNPYQGFGSSQKSSRIKSSAYESSSSKFYQGQKKQGGSSRISESSKAVDDKRKRFERHK